jgi:hypothetical protein
MLVLCLFHEGHTMPVRKHAYYMKNEAKCAALGVDFRGIFVFRQRLNQSCMPSCDHVIVCQGYVFTASERYHLTECMKPDPSSGLMYSADQA